MLLPTEYPLKTFSFASSDRPPLTPVLKDAAMTHRVTCGVMKCADLLRSNHDNVMLCVLPDVTGKHDVIYDIQQTLIEAFCIENCINVLKVGDTTRLTSLLMEQNLFSDVTAASSISCILIEYPTSSPTTPTSDYRHPRRCSLYLQDANT